MQTSASITERRQRRATTWLVSLTVALGLASGCPTITAADEYPSEVWTPYPSEAWSPRLAALPKESVARPEPPAIGVAAPTPSETPCFGPPPLEAETVCQTYCDSPNYVGY